MYWNRSAADIAAAWQTEIENKLETGATAILPVGAPDALLASATTLLGQQASALRRADIATPQFVAGGNSALWLGLLISPHVTGTTHAPTPTFIYAGADSATNLATIGMKSGMTAAMSQHFAPRFHPAHATPWEMLPMLEVGEQPLAGVDTTITTNTAHEPTDDWIAWGVMLLALCLVVSALLI